LVATDGVVGIGAVVVGSVVIGSGVVSGIGSTVGVVVVGVF
jgi:hypothetical protein